MNWYNISIQMPALRSRVPVLRLAHSHFFAVARNIFALARALIRSDRVIRGRADPHPEGALVDVAERPQPFQRLLVDRDL